MASTMLVFLSLLALSSALTASKQEIVPEVLIEPNPKNTITFSELDGRCLPGDNDLPDQIILSEDFPPAECLHDYVGIRLVLGDFVDEWKAVMLHKRGDASYYKPLVEEWTPVFPPYEPSIIYFKYADLLNYDICLWKDIDQFIGTEKRNVYLLQDSRTYLQPNTVYTFYWFRDDVCT